MATNRQRRTPWAGEHWRDTSEVVVIRASGKVEWRFPYWSAARKRKYLETRRESVRNLDPDDFDPNRGSLGILAKAVEEAEAEECRAQNSKSPNLAHVPLME